jgi:SAM-dependent methyltransferase
MLKTKRDQYALLRKGRFGRIISDIYPNLVLEAIGRIGIDRAARILDVGCGAGNVLYSLRDAGFTSLTGVDPYIDRDITDGPINIFKTTVHTLSESQRFDLIISSHSFEHIPDQLKTLTAIGRLLSEKSICLLRIPVKTEYIWDLYNVNWVQLDAPRHLFLHTLKSFGLLAGLSNLSIQEVHFDSTEFQFWGSEQYMRDIPLLSANSYQVSHSKSIFSAESIRRYRKAARELNAMQQGDQAAFHLVRIPA